MIFSELGVSLPTTLQQYKQYIMKIQVGGIFGAYNVIDAYLNIRLHLYLIFPFLFPFS